MIGSILNVKKRERDFWSQKYKKRHKPTADTLRRDKFLEIKRFLKLPKKSDENLNNKI